MRLDRFLQAMLPRMSRAAIQDAIEAAGTSNRIVFLDAGTYDVSDTLQWPSRFRRLILEGSGAEHTVIRLADDASEFFFDPKTCPRT